MAKDIAWINQYVRRIHMDFHTPEVEPDLVIKQFDARSYIATLKAAHVNSLVTFAKCHHGNSYYNTHLGHRHAGLPEGLDMMGEILQEAHRNGMKVIAYFSIGWLTPIQKNHPEWLERNAQGQSIGTGNHPKSGPWDCICLNSPYPEQIVFPQLKEIVSGYPIDGIWLDIIENNPCYCRWCQAAYQARYGRPLPQALPEVVAFALQTRREFVERCVNLIRSANPEVLVTFNTAGRNADIVPLVDFCSIETHPGSPSDKGAWTRSLLTYKFLQKYDKPWETSTSRFIHGWGGWDDQALANIQAVSSRILAHGGVINLGDQAYPTGRLDPELYQKIGQNYAFIEPRERWAVQPRRFPYIALLATEFDIYGEGNANYLGAAKVLNEKHWHFDLLDEGRLDRLGDYRCLVLPETGLLKPETVSRLEDYVRRSGRLFATGNTSLPGNGDNFQLADLFGCDYRGESRFSTGYLEVEDAIGQNVRRSPLLVPGRFFDIAPREGVETLARRIDPLIEPDVPALHVFRHERFAPPGRPAGSQAIILNHYGNGQVAYAAAPLFSLFWNDSQWYLADVAHNVLDRLVTKKLVTLDAPACVELNVTEKDGHVVAHLINYQLHKETYQVQQIVPVVNLKLSFASGVVSPEGIFLAPDNALLHADVIEGRVVVNIPKVELYTQVVFKKI
jgi:hypothetical protein